MLAGITLLYTVFGGLKLVWTDVLQGSIMLIGSLSLLAAVMIQGEVCQHCSHNSSALTLIYYNPMGEHFLSFSLMFSFWILVGFGALCLPHCATRCLSFNPKKSTKDNCHWSL